MGRTIETPFAVAFVALISACLCGCASYATPRGGADMRAFGAPEKQSAINAATDRGLAATLAKKPLASFPTGVAVVRVQQAGYRTRTAEGFGVGQYCVVTVRDVETDAQLDRLSRLPLVHGIAPVNRLLLPTTLQTDAELRAAAASLHADMLLIYTLDTQFRVDDKAAPLTVITLGLSPNQRAYVTCTASALLLDTRNGYVYGVAEATERADQIASGWTSANAVDESRLRAESGAFDKLVGEFEKTWGGVVAQYARRDPAKAPSARTAD